MWKPSAKTEGVIRKIRAKRGTECGERERSPNRLKDFECSNYSTNLSGFPSSACSANQNGNLPRDHSALTPALGYLLAGEYLPPTELTRREKKRKQKPKSTSLLVSLNNVLCIKCAVRSCGQLNFLAQIFYPGHSVRVKTRSAHIGFGSRSIVRPDWFWPLSDYIKHPSTERSYLSGCR